MIPRILQGLTILYVLFIVLLLAQILWATYAKTFPEQLPNHGINVRQTQIRLQYVI